jgi:hypothetical protein
MMTSIAIPVQAGRQCTVVGLLRGKSQLKLHRAPEVRQEGAQELELVGLEAVALGAPRHDERDDVAGASHQRDLREAVEALRPDHLVVNVGPVVVVAEHLLAGQEIVAIKRDQLDQFRIGGFRAVVPLEHRHTLRVDPHIGDRKDADGQALDAEMHGGPAERIADLEQDAVPVAGRRGGGIDVADQIEQQFVTQPCHVALQGEGRG